jgi:hypothetical protein
MHVSLYRSGLAGLALAALFALPAGAETVNLKVAPLSAASEVPPNTSKATGTVTATYDTASKKLSWKGSYAGLTGPATAAHFHAAAQATVNGPVQVPIAPATSPFEGSATLTDAQAADLLAGRFYVNVHTAANPGGEIRGQVTK